MEAWDPSEKPNLTYSHPWGAPLVWVVAEYLLGVRATSPAFATFDVRPQLGLLSRASSAVPTIRGPIPVDVNQTMAPGMKKGLAPVGMTLRVHVPGSTRARVFAPMPDRHSQVEVDGVRIDESKKIMELPHE